MLKLNYDFLNRIIKQLEKSTTMYRKQLNWSQILEVCGNSIIAQECCEKLRDDGWITWEAQDSDATYPSVIVTTDKFITYSDDRYY